MNSTSSFVASRALRRLRRSSLRVSIISIYLDGCVRLKRRATTLLNFARTMTLLLRRGKPFNL
jgi:hypothetical protein